MNGRCMGAIGNSISVTGLLMGVY